MGPKKIKEVKPKPTDIINFYELPEVQSFQKTYHNPNFESHRITIPFRGIILGASGSGKSNCVLNIINQFTDTFNHIKLFVKNKEEPLYQYLEKKIPERDQLEVFEGLDELNKLNLDKDLKGQTLIIFDDLMLEPKQGQIEQLYIRGRKLAGGVSLLYLSQSFYTIPRKVRLQCNYIILRKIPSARDVNGILKEFSLGVDKEELIKIYQYSVNKSITSFLLIDLNVDPELSFRRNFNEVLDLNQFK
jgi:Poxvirus A32 protein